MLPTLLATFLAQVMPLDAERREVLPNGCSYAVSIQGSLLPEGDRRGTPRAVIQAGVNCPFEATLLTNDLSTDASLDEDTLLRELAERATVVTDASGRTCTYRPVLRFRRGRLLVQDLKVTCR